MLLEDFGKIMENDKAGYAYTIYIPSKQKELEFRNLSTGELKSIAKMSIDDSFDIQYEVTKLAIIKNLCLSEELNLNELTEIDMIAILAGVKVNNPMKETDFTTKCNNCSEKFVFKINFNEMVANSKLHKPIVGEFEYKHNKLNFMIMLSEPSNIVELEYIRLINIYKEDDTINDEELKKKVILNSFIKFIKEVYINGDKIEDWSGKKFHEKMMAVDNHFPSKMIFKDGGLQTKITELFGKNYVNSIFPKVRCPHCKKEKEGMIDSKSFFIV